MTVFKHELRLGRTPLIIWTAAVAFLLAVCVFIYPEMKGQMAEISTTFSQLGGFSEAFGMDQINFADFIGFFGVECGNVLGLGGAFFAALLGISSLAKEEKEHTAEFLLTHPQSRARVLTEKLCAVLAQIVIFNLVVVGITAFSIAMIGEAPDIGITALLFLSYFLAQIEIAAVCFGISAFLRRGGLGIGLGLAAVFYFLNIIANLTEQAEFLKYLTPFGYAESSDIITNGSLSGGYLAVGMAFAAVGVLLAFCKYTKKDLS